MKARSARAKGHKGQKRVVNLLRETFKLSEYDVFEREGSSNGTDIILSAHALSLIPLAIEVKWRYVLPFLTGTPYIAVYQGNIDKYKNQKLYIQNFNQWVSSQYPKVISTAEGHQVQTLSINYSRNSTPFKWFDQAKCNARCGITPVVFCIQNYDKDIYVISAE